MIFEDVIDNLRRVQSILPFVRWNLQKFARNEPNVISNALQVVKNEPNVRSILLFVGCKIQRVISNGSSVISKALEVIYVLKEFSKIAYDLYKKDQKNLENLV